MEAMTSIVRLVVRCLLAMGFAVGLLAVGFSFVEGAVFGAGMDRLAPDGAADWFTPARIQALKQAMFLLGTTLLVVVVGAAVAHRHIAHGIVEAWTAARVDGRAARCALRSFLERERSHAFLLVAFCVVYTVLAWSWVDQPVRTDEAQTFMYYLTKPWYYVVGRYTTNNHILYSLLASGSCAAGLSEPLCLRLPALFAGVLLIPASYLCMRLHLGSTVGLLTSAMVASSPYAIDFATNGRGYTALALVFSVLLSLARGLVEGGNPARWCLFVLVSALGFWVVPVMAYPFGIVLVWFAVAALQTREEGQWRILAPRLFGAVMAVGGLVALLYSPAFIVTGFEAVVVNDTVLANRAADPQSLLSLTGVVAYYVARDWAHGVYLFLPAWLALGFAIGCFAPAPAGSGHRRLALALPVGIAGVLGVTQAIPPSWIFLFALPLLIGLGWSGWRLWLEVVLRGRWPAWTGAVFVVLAALLPAVNLWSIHSSNALEYPRWYVGYRDAPEMASRLVEVLRPGDVFRGHPVVVPPLLFELRKLGVVDTGAFVLRDPAPGRDRYFVESRHRGAAELLTGLQAEWDVTVEEVERFERSALLRLRAPSDATTGGVHSRDGDEPVTVPAPNG